jgi:hypothetical protein
VIARAGGLRQRPLSRSPKARADPGPEEQSAALIAAPSRTEKHLLDISHHEQQSEALLLQREAATRPSTSSSGFDSPPLPTEQKRDFNRPADRPNPSDSRRPQH